MGAGAMSSWLVSSSKTWAHGVQTDHAWPPRGPEAMVTGRFDGHDSRCSPRRAPRGCYPEMTAINLHAAITRDEFERTIDELRAEMKSSSSHATATDSADFERLREVFVLKDEFRLFKWFGGLALAAVLSGMGLLYQAIAEQRVAMERQFADLRAEMHAGFRAITANVDSRFVTVDSRFVTMDSRFARMDSRIDDLDSRFDAMDSKFDAMDSKFDAMDSRFDDMDSRVTALQHDVADVKERLARVETLLDVKNRERLPD